MLARHVSDLIGPSTAAFCTSCIRRLWYVVIRVLLDTSSCPRFIIQSKNMGVPTAMILHSALDVLILSVCTGSLLCDFQTLGFLTKQLNILQLMLQCNKLCTTRFTEKHISAFGDSMSDSVGLLHWLLPGNFLINFPFSFFYYSRIIIR